MPVRKKLVDDGGVRGSRDYASNEIGTVLV